MYGFRLYGLRVACDRPIAGLATVRSRNIADVRVRFARRRCEIRADQSLQTYASLGSDGIEYLRVLRDADGGFVFRFHNGARFEVSADGARVSASHPASIASQDAISCLLGPVLGFVARLRGAVCLHASAVMAAGGAVAFLGPSGAGKSSLCAYFASRGAAVLTDDVLALRRERDGFHVLAGAPRLGLWPDSVRTLYGAQADLPRLLPSDPGWEKRYREIAPGAASARLLAIYTGGAGDAPSPRVSAATGRDAFLRLAANRYPVRLPVPGRTSMEFETLAAVADQVPVRCIRSRRGIDGLGALHDAVRRDLRRLSRRGLRAAA